MLAPKKVAVAAATTTDAQNLIVMVMYYSFSFVYWLVEGENAR